MKINVSLLYRRYFQSNASYLSVICQSICQVSRIFFSAVREGNDRQTVDGNNSIKFKTTFVGEHTTYLTLNECVLKYLRCDFAE